MGRGWVGEAEDSGIPRIPLATSFLEIILSCIGGTA